ncbi:MAG: hypothetical protein Q7U14_03775, partial [Lacisediminimonas sp.]|nr:hypothetical protein [Lacisediminimonas sp.]
MNSDLSGSKRVKDSTGHASTSTDGAAKKRSKHDRSASGDVDGLRVTQESRKQKKLVTLPEGGHAETPPVSQEPNYTSLGASSAGRSKASKATREKEKSDDKTRHTSSRQSGVVDDADVAPKKRKKKSDRPERASMPAIPTDWREVETSALRASRSPLKMVASATLAPAFDISARLVQEESTILRS